MRWWTNIMENLKTGVRSWLDIQPANERTISIKESLDFYGNAIKNRIWYRGDSAELKQLYSQIEEARQTFWGAQPSPGMELNKIHTGLPALMVDVITNVVLTGLNEFEFKSSDDGKVWDAMDKEGHIKKLIEEAVKDTLVVGDGAFKITYDAVLSEYPIIEFYPGDKIEIIRKRGRITEIVFSTVYVVNKKEYVLKEHYGYGYIKYKLTREDKEVPLDALPETQNLVNVAFAGYEENEDGTIKQKGAYMMAVPLMFFSSSKWEGRGQSIFDKKIDAFDSLDETWSQWMDALRAGRSKEYIPDCLIPKNPNTGTMMSPNAFDNRFIATNSDMSENAKNEIVLKQPAIPHESYTATYITALDLCLQGVISPSTLGIDVKKLDNADAQREKEKATLYTRDAIVDALIEDLKALASSSIMAYRELNVSEGAEIKPVEVDVTFAEYANPSFESQIETIGKGKQYGIMSIEASVDELYGDTKDESWKKEEIARLKAEQGIATVEEPGVNETAGSFQLQTNGGTVDASKGGKQNLPNETGAV